MVSIRVDGWVVVMVMAVEELCWESWEVVWFWFWFWFWWGFGHGYRVCGLEIHMYTGYDVGLG